MHEASAHSRPGSYLRFREGQSLLPPTWHCFRLSLTRSGVIAWDQTGTRYSLEALLLLEFPLLFTFTTFVELPPFADADHQLQRLHFQRLSLNPYFFFFWLSVTLSLSLWWIAKPISRFKRFNISSIEPAVAEGITFCALCSNLSNCLQQVIVFLQ